MTSNFSQQKFCLTWPHNEIYGNLTSSFHPLPNFPEKKTKANLHRNPVHLSFGNKKPTSQQSFIVSLSRCSQEKWGKVGIKGGKLSNRWRSSLPDPCQLGLPLRQPSEPCGFLYWGSGGFKGPASSDGRGSDLQQKTPVKMVVFGWGCNHSRLSFRVWTSLIVMNVSLEHDLLSTGTTAENSAVSKQFGTVAGFVHAFAVPIASMYRYIYLHLLYVQINQM